MFNFFNRKPKDSSQEWIEMAEEVKTMLDSLSELRVEVAALDATSKAAVELVEMPAEVEAPVVETVVETEVEMEVEMGADPTVVDQLVEARDAVQAEIEETEDSEAQADEDADVLETLTLEVVGLNNHLIDVKERAQKALSRKAQAEADAKVLLGMLGKGKKIEYLTPAQRVAKAEAKKAEAERLAKEAEAKAEAEAKRLEAEAEAKAEAARLEAADEILKWCEEVEAKESEAAELRRRITQPYFYN